MEDNNNNNNNNNVENEICGCGCGVEFIPNTIGFKFEIVNEMYEVLDIYIDWEIAHESWVNYINPTILCWGEFKNIIIASHKKKPDSKVWTHLFNMLCDIKLKPIIHHNSQIDFTQIN